MEVVLLGSALSNIAVLLIERYAKRPPRPENVPEAQRGSTAEGTRSAEHAEGKNDHSEGQQSSEMEECPEGSIPALEKKLKELRTEAKRVNSPDTFVQYARLSREANKVEKELVEKKGKAHTGFRYRCIHTFRSYVTNALFFLVPSIAATAFIDCCSPRTKQQRFRRDLRADKASVQSDHASCQDIREAKRAANGREDCSACVAVLVNVGLLLAVPK